MNEEIAFRKTLNGNNNNNNAEFGKLNTLIYKITSARGGTRQGNVRIT